MKTPPETIWLQYYDEDGKPLSEYGDEDLTWCSDKINDTDVEYIRADTYREQMAIFLGALKIYKRILERLTKQIKGYDDNEAYEYDGDI